jgi:hypothetical protein
MRTPESASHFPGRVELVVDELVIHGFSPDQARAAAAAFEARLTALAATPASIAERDESVRLLPAVEAGTPAGVGEAAAGAVWRELVG